MWVLTRQTPTEKPTLALLGIVFSGGGGRIRTHGTLAGPTVFKTVAIDHSATPPCGRF